MGKTILIIEDEKDLLDSYKELVESVGFNSMVATDGYQGLDILASQLGNIDLVLLDLMMPGVDGLEVLKAMKTNKEKYGDIPVIILTNMTSDTVIKEAFDLGASSYLVKIDLDYEGLVKEIEKYLG
ncbi:MAG TPA: response regulator [Candidatus Dojkabacteria bacterium]|jgi:CheY-like chemotaxis protein|nr:response regulator [Candidatus Dojkabacteria bacterium]HOF79032.1 response regulator [Candidatus Dojkabacteria bacterium]HOR06066.1 response regulator [Candidatus Dojkabacteria bacterium]HQI92664.1 response regulator [Candidatus Dojkabacteria bacterium]